MNTYEYRMTAKNKALSQSKSLCDESVRLGHSQTLGRQFGDSFRESEIWRESHVIYMDFYGFSMLSAIFSCPFC